jgi:hypothetical protein
MLAPARGHGADQTSLERDAEERRRPGVSFQELAAEYPCWLDEATGRQAAALAPASTSDTIPAVATGARPG